MFRFSTILSKKKRRRTHSCTPSNRKINPQVSKEKGEKLAKEYGIKFMEVSAKDSINVEDAFFSLASGIKVEKNFWKVGG